MWWTALTPSLKGILVYKEETSTVAKSVLGERVPMFFNFEIKS